MDDKPKTYADGALVRMTWKDLRMAKMLTVINDALGPHGWCLTAVVNEGTGVEDDRSEDVLEMVPCRTADGKEWPRAGNG